jgi:hypothetical protein
VHRTDERRVVHQVRDHRARELPGLKRELLQPSHVLLIPAALVEVHSQDLDAAQIW